MKPVNLLILTTNGDLSSIKFALFEAGPIRVDEALEAELERIGLPGATLRVKVLSSTGQLFAASDGAGSHGGSRRANGVYRGIQRA